MEVVARLTKLHDHLILVAFGNLISFIMFVSEEQSQGEASSSSDRVHVLLLLLLLLLISDFNCLDKTFPVNQCPSKLITRKCRELQN